MELGNGSCGRKAITMERYQLKRQNSYEFTFTIQQYQN